ncbi:SusC/RagA family TonB-linked outer membrane protein [Sediminibacterium goheungense]|nr:SusC/RagA family TonB-linked outer membrane protein [Sediminibacterium goheungense]
MRKCLTVMRMALLLFFISSLPAFSQGQSTVSGTVLADEDGTPLVGVTVTNGSTNKRTQTNTAGYYSIAAEKGQRLTFAYVGYASVTMTVADEKTISIKMVTNDKELGNVVVTAYGQQRNKRELAYQAPVVKGDDVAQTRRENFLNSLAGRVPGLAVTSTSGLPGASAQVILRGGASIAGNNQPLFVVDGVPLDNSSLNQEALPAASNPNGIAMGNRNSDYTNRIADLNPDDIENITILKGPEATALYGSDGTSGAIIITTRKGTAGRTRVNYDNSFRWDKVYRFPQIQTVYGRGAAGLADPNSYATYGFRMFGPAYPKGTQLYDNLRNFFRTAKTQQHNVSVEAGTADATYRFSAGYLKQEGIVPNTSFERMNFRLTGSAKLGKKVTMSSSWMYTISNNDKAPKGLNSYYPNIINWPLNDDIRLYINPDGTRRPLRNNLAGNLAAEADNPFWDVNKNKSNDRNDRITGNVNIAYTPYKWWNMNWIVGVDQFSTDGMFVTHPYSRWGFITRGYFSSYQQNFRGLNGTFRTTFTKTIAKKFTNSLTFGAYIEDAKRSINAQRGERFYEPDFVSINNTDPLSRDARLTREQIRKVRYFSNYTFGFNNLFFITASATREGVSTLTSKYNDKQPFFNYGSLSSSFVFSDLQLFKKMEWLDYGKLRASYATSGKAPYVPYVIDYSFGSQITTGGGYALGVFGNNFDLQPEFSKNFEVGAELNFLKRRITVDVAYFNNKVTKQIVSNRLSYGTGFVLKYINGGELSAKGWEVQLKATPVRSKNFGWDVTVNFDKSRVIVEKMPADLPAYYDSDTWLYGNARSQVSVGTSLANISGSTYQRNNRGDILISPTTGLPLIQANFDPIGDRNPDFKIGLINQLSFGESWQLSFNLDIRKGGDVFNANEMMMRTQGTSVNTLDRETPRVIKGVLADGLQNTANPTVNTIAVTPFLRNDFYSSSASVSTLPEAEFIENVNWVRMRDLTLAYRLPASILKRQKVFKQASIFVTGTDLFMITNYSGVDPNVNGINAGNARGFGGQGIDFGSVATPRGINVGIKVQF